MKKLVFNLNVEKNFDQKNKVKDIIKESMSPNTKFSIININNNQNPFEVEIETDKSRSKYKLQSNISNHPDVKNCKLKEN